jgi:hypothetical protein
LPDLNRSNSFWYSAMKVWSPESLRNFWARLMSRPFHDGTDDSRMTCRSFPVSSIADSMSRCVNALEGPISVLSAKASVLPLNIWFTTECSPMRFCANETVTFSLAWTGSMDDVINLSLFSDTAMESFTSSMSSKQMSSGRWTPTLKPRIFADKPFALRM